MKIEAPFYLRETCTDSIMNLLQKTTLGTNGARYIHLDTADVIENIDSPLFLSLERNNKALGNITFCRRKENYYLRYFAFEQFLQSEKSSTKIKNSALKKTIKAYFDGKLQENINFYAYIDPKNDRSKQMGAIFGFNKVGSLKTYSFSRLKPKTNPRIETLTANELDLLVNFKQNNFYVNTHPKRTKIYGLKNENGEITAAARVQKANWQIECLPGKFGKLLIKIIPFIPFLNQILNPKKYKFIVTDKVFSKDATSLKSLFEGILAEENEKLILWWIDEKSPLNKFSSQISWGFFKLFLGNPTVDVLAKLSTTSKFKKEQEIFVAGMDLI